MRPPFGPFLGHPRPDAGPTTKHLGDALRDAEALRLQLSGGIVKAPRKKIAPPASTKDQT